MSPRRPPSGIPTRSRSKSVSTRFPLALKEAIEYEAEARRTTVSAVVVEAVHTWIQERSVFRGRLAGHAPPSLPPYASDPDEGTDS